MIDLSKISLNELFAEMVKDVNRFEVIDHSKDFKGRCYTKYDCHVEAEFQDGRKTLKIFVVDREPKPKFSEGRPGGLLG